MDKATVYYDILENVNEEDNVESVSFVIVTKDENVKAVILV